jgi:hypothetical protein
MRIGRPPGPSATEQEREKIAEHYQSGLPIREIEAALAPLAVRQVHRVISLLLAEGVLTRRPPGLNRKSSKVSRFECADADHHINACDARARADLARYGIRYRDLPGLDGLAFRQVIAERNGALARQNLAGSPFGSSAAMAADAGARHAKRFT